MIDSLKRSEYRFSAAVTAIVQSRQFQEDLTK
jgi:hypothetical protein